MQLIHRSDMNARARCGATGAVRLSVSGVMLTCPECVRLSAPPSRDLVMEQIRQAADAYQKRTQAEKDTEAETLAGFYATHPAD